MVKKEEKIKKNLFTIGFAVATIIVVLLFYKNIWITNLLVFLIAIIGLSYWKSKRTLLIFIFAGIFGTLAEIVCIRYGVWKYSVTNFYNIPIWLFVVWGNAGAFIYQIAILIKNKKLKW